MSETNHFETERLTEIHKARDDWEGNLLVVVLRDSGIKAVFRGTAAVNLDVAHILKGTDDVLGVFVLAHEADRARELVQEFISTATDPAVLEEAAAQKFRVDKETISRLRGELREERQTFEFLGWVGVAFLGAAAVLWMIWPEWLKNAVPADVLRWGMVALLGLGAIFAGNWAGRKL